MILKIVMTLGVISFAAVAVSPRARLFAVWLLGRNAGCSVQNTLNSHENLLRTKQAEADLTAHSRVIQTEPSGFELIDTPRGQYWASRHEPLIGFLLAEQQSEIYGDVTHGVQPGDIVLDCGANIGVFTRSALSRGARLVIAIEPAPLTVEALQRTFAQEIAGGRVVVYPKGVWDRPATMDLTETVPGTMTANSVVFRSSTPRKTYKVPLTTIDLIVDELHLPRVDFIKMDIEGAEKWALRGATQTIKKFRPRMALSTEHLPDDAVAIPQVVKTIWPDYRFEPPAGACSDHFLSVISDVLIFQPK